MYVHIVSTYVLVDGGRGGEEVADCASVVCRIL